MKKEERRKMKEERRKKKEEWEGKESFLSFPCLSFHFLSFHFLPSRRKGKERTGGRRYCGGTTLYLVLGCSDWATLLGGKGGECRRATYLFRNSMFLLWSSQIETFKHSKIRKFEKFKNSKFRIFEFFEFSNF